MPYTTKSKDFDSVIYCVSTVKVLVFASKDIKLGNKLSFA